MAILKRHKFGRTSEQSGSRQLCLLDEAVGEDISAIELELEQNASDLGQAPKTKRVKTQLQCLSLAPRKRRRPTYGLTL